MGIMHVQIFTCENVMMGVWVWWSTQLLICLQTEVSPLAPPTHLYPCKADMYLQTSCQHHEHEAAIRNCGPRLFRCRIPARLVNGTTACQPQLSSRLQCKKVRKVVSCALGTSINSVQLYWVRY